MQNYFVQELIKIGGIDEFGDPVLRLVWGPDELDHKGSPRYLKETSVEKQEKVRESGLITIEFIKTKHPIERYAIEEKWHPDLLHDWELNRWHFDEETAELIDLFGEFPQRGQYRTLLILEDNNGNFIMPDERVLMMLRSCVNRRNYEIRHAKNEKASKFEIEQQVRERLDRKAKLRQSWKESLKDDGKQILLAHRNRLNRTHPDEGTQSSYRRGLNYNPSHWPFRKESECKI